jgi:hypothetical protein
VTFTGDRFVFYDCAENKDGKVIYIMKMSVEDTPPPSWNLYEEIDYGNNKGKCE